MPVKRKITEADGVYLITFRLTPGRAAGFIMAIERTGPNIGYEALEMDALHRINRHSLLPDKTNRYRRQIHLHQHHNTAQ